MTDQARAETPEALVAQLIDLLDVERLDTDLYRGARQPGGVGRVFGGQVIAQALQAAQRSVDGGKEAHSLHAYFMRAGNEDFPIIYRVVRDFDGKSFANRRIIAMQQGQPILNMTASFQLPEPGMAHQDAMPDVPPPEALKSEAVLRAEMGDRIPEKFRKFFLRARPIEIRPVAVRDWFAPEKLPPVQHGWFRVAAPLPDDPALHRAMLSYASDMSLLGTCLLPHGVNWLTHPVQTASLDHAVWLHEPFRFDDWLLYTCDSPWAGHARGFNRGKFFDRHGRLVASTTQEGLIRMRG
ncbi:MULTISPECIES: acyl-CoA thioesterase [unclassified Sphingomonas]|jgi:acyl-CoA thioesterase-2|uniref:acyl-CoA thioesterase n=1 Tax=unclassified Sphingomonas TaxID=196159 RepID=UPI00082F00D4|nr:MULTISPECIES: acyl-CoA thioesterase II [unclassified Sphingomonas]MCH4892915.1 acyl-CoA thioesterase II [Sphingomonas sp. SFZ2018-12]